jgi:hypothetical protein
MTREKMVGGGLPPPTMNHSRLLQPYAGRPGLPPVVEATAVPHRGRHDAGPQPPAQVTMHTSLGSAQKPETLQSPPAPKAFCAQTTPAPPAAWEQKQAAVSVQSFGPAQCSESGGVAQPGSHEKHVDPGVSHRSYWAKAGARRLVSTGADHATAAPAPMRLSIRRREILSTSIERPPSIKVSDLKQVQAKDGGQARLRHPSAAGTFVLRDRPSAVACVRPHSASSGGAVGEMSSNDGFEEFRWLSRGPIGTGRGRR